MKRETVLHDLRLLAAGANGASTVAAQYAVSDAEKWAYYDRIARLLDRLKKCEDQQKASDE